jgi:hypothetical protein
MYVLRHLYRMFSLLCITLVNKSNKADSSLSSLQFLDTTNRKAVRPGVEAAWAHAAAVEVQAVRDRRTADRTAPVAGVANAVQLTNAAAPGAGKVTDSMLARM